MPSTMLTSKGQITLPVEIRKEMGLKFGDRLEFTRNTQTGTYEMSRKTGSITNLLGIAKYNGPPATIEQLNEARTEAAVDRYLGSKKVGE